LRAENEGEWQCPLRFQASAPAPHSMMVNASVMTPLKLRARGCVDKPFSVKLS
jgi:hypothetical protein